ncbi:MAG: VOC family protein [Parasphingorhabdus sp.]
MKIRSQILIAGMLWTAPLAAQENSSDQNVESQTLDLNHIGFAVSKLDATASFFIDTLGWKAAGGRPEYPAKFVTNGKMFVTLWQVTNPDKAVAFDRKNNVGLHHMAITVRDLETLNNLHKKFVAHPYVVVEFAPEHLGNGPTTHMMIREPSGLRLEFIVPANRINEAD